MVSRSSAVLQKIMRAIRVTEFGGPEVCKVAEIPVPTAEAGQVSLSVFLWLIS